VFGCRAKLFNVISSTGYITLEKWLSWAIEHIAGKSVNLPKVNPNPELCFSIGLFPP
jgi:hypothetical protein